MKSSFISTLSNSFKPLFLLFILSTNGFAQLSSKFEPGTVHKQVVSISDPDQSYEVFIPSHYDPSKTWPVLFVMDPRSRGAVPLSGFMEAADSLGYIIMSSNNSLSDGPLEANVPVINAMMNDAIELFSVDQSRFYLAGFSGTARNAWTFGFQLKGNVAGVIGVGAANSNIAAFSANVMLSQPDFSYYGIVGFYDYNYYEMVRFEGILKELEFPHHMNFFEGYHQWPTNGQLNEALYWMEFRAMVENRIPADHEYIRKLFTRLTNPNQPVIRRNDPYELYNYYSSLKRNFTGYADLSDVEQILHQLESDPDRLKTEKQLITLNDQYYQYNTLLLRTFEDFKKDRKDFDYNRLAKQLQLQELKSRSENNPDLYVRRLNKSLLELLFVHVYFYQTREYIEEEKFKKAYAILQLGQMIYPNDPRTCYQFSRVYSQLGDTDKAFESLECLANAKGLTLQFLEQDPYLTPLRINPKFEELREGL